MHTASQNIGVHHCRFTDLGGGAVSVGDVMLTRNVSTDLQLANISVEVGLV